MTWGNHTNDLLWDLQEIFIIPRTSLQPLNASIKADFQLAEGLRSVTGYFWMLDEFSFCRYWVFLRGQIVFRLLSNSHIWLLKIKSESKQATKSTVFCLLKVYFVWSIKFFLIVTQQLLKQLSQNICLVFPEPISRSRYKCSRRNSND